MGRDAIIGLKTNHTVCEGMLRICAINSWNTGSNGGWMPSVKFPDRNISLPMPSLLNVSMDNIVPLNKKYRYLNQRTTIKISKVRFKF